MSKLESQPELEELIDIIRNSTAVAWSHVNLLGVYDFTRAAFRKLLNNSQLRFDLQKLKEWKYKRMDWKKPYNLLYFSRLDGSILL